MDQGNATQTSPSRCHPVAFLPGANPDEAYRVSTADCGAGMVKIEQLGQNGQLGWYTQKSFVIPADLIQGVRDALGAASALLASTGRGEGHGDETLRPGCCASPCGHEPAAATSPAVPAASAPFKLRLVR